jgi:hypothetical protein
VDVLNILVNPDGKVFMSMDKVPDLEQTVKALLENNGLPALNPTQLKNFKEDPMFGIGLRELHSYLDQKQGERVKILPQKGIPTDSIAGGMSEFQQWVKEAKKSARNSETLESHELKICIKADSKTSYKTVKKLMSELQDMEENRYQLITSYKVQETKEVQ